MIRVILFIALLLIGCSNRDSSNTNNYSQEQTEQISNEQYNEGESNHEQVEGGNQNSQVSRSDGGVIAMFVNGVIILLIVALAIGVYLKRKQYIERISRLKVKLKEYSNRYQDKAGELKKIKNHYRSLENNLKKVKKEKKELEEAISRLQNKTTDTSSDKLTNDIAEIETKGENFDKADEEKKIANRKTELFFTVPDGQGKFKHESGISNCEEKRLYKLTYQPGEAEGTIEFISSKYDGIAINHKDSMIKPVCNIIKENENNPSSVSQNSPGKVKRVGDEWVIDYKIKVEIL